MRQLIQYLNHRPLVANVIMFGTLLAALLLWNKIGKEEMPEFSMEWIRVSVVYPGASAQDVELFISKPVEEKLKGITGIDTVRSTSSYGMSSLSVSFEPGISDLKEKIQEVKDAVESTPFPSEAKDPTYRQFRSAEKAIIDIGVYLKDKELLSTNDRLKLQEYVLAFKNKLLAKPEISGVDETGYLRPEIQIKVKPKFLERFELSMNQIKNQVIKQNVRQPIGRLEDKQESDVTLQSALDTKDAISNVIVSSGFQGQKVTLSQVATVEDGFIKTSTINKIQGHEGIILNVKKSSNTDILSAQQVVLKFLESFKSSNLDSPIEFVLMDDESYDVRNRLSLIGTNGLIGFILIAIILFLFLDFKTGIWVAMGIPFSLAITLILALSIGFTVNNMTLAAIIIVLGIVVDDAIIVAENIARRMKKENKDDSVVNAVLEVASPVIASMLTTCAAFLPLYFFSGHFGLFVRVLPTVIFIMLGASLLESFFILPAHLGGGSKGRFSQFPFVIKVGSIRTHVISKFERLYAKTLQNLLSFRGWIILGFLLLLVGSVFVFTKKMNYVMFPREESRDIRLKVVASDGINRFEMAKKITPLENFFVNDKVVTSVSSRIGQSRRGGEVKENEASIRLEFLAPSERTESLNQLIRRWSKELERFEGFEEIKFQKSRFGSDSGSPIVIEVQENNDKNRDVIVERLKMSLLQNKALANVEIEKPIPRNEFQLNIKKTETSRLGIDYGELASTLRAYVEGNVLYTLNTGEEEVDVRFTSRNENKDNIDDLLNLTVSNKDGYLVPVRGLVDVTRHVKAANIERVNFKRTTTLYADLSPETALTPLEVAAPIENTVFPAVSAGIPSASLFFRGEVEDSRESKSDFSLSIGLILVIIYVLLVFLFDSLLSPFLIGAIIPFGMVGSIMAFYFHGMTQYGFFAVIGTLGMIGVVINDSIVLIDRLNMKLDFSVSNKGALFESISKITSSRLRAVLVTTITTVAGLFPTAYGLGGYDSMLAEMMLAMAWGLLFGMIVTLVITPCIFSYYAQLKMKFKGV